MLTVPFALFGALALLAPASAGASEPAAVECVESFLNSFQTVRSYRAILDKIEFEEDGGPKNQDRLEIFQRRPVFTKITYLNEGSSGIKNNGMVAEYDGSPKLKIHLGHTSGLGFLVSGPASLVIGSSVSITDPNVLRGEYFTVNHAGLLAFAAFAFAAFMKTRLPQLRAAKRGGLSLRDGVCRISYRRHTDEVQTLRLTPEDSVLELEERLGTLAYFLLKIPGWFFDFDVDLNPETRFPERIVFYLDGRVLADYRYRMLEVEK